MLTFWSAGSGFESQAAQVEPQHHLLTFLLTDTLKFSLVTSSKILSNLSVKLVNRQKYQFNDFKKRGELRSSPFNTITL